MMLTRLRRAALYADPALPFLVTTAIAVVIVAYFFGGWNAVMMITALAWLIVLAIYDVKFHEVPHSGLVLVPYLLASGLAVWRGEWGLGAMALVVLAASERHRLPQIWQRWVMAGAVMICLILMARLDPERIAGAMALMGFWLMFELNWWAGMDAMAAITLVVLWPDLGMVLAIGVAHLALALYRRRWFTFPRRLRPEELLQSGQPGFPALALSMALYLVIWLMA